MLQYVDIITCKTSSLQQKSSGKEGVIKALVLEFLLLSTLNAEQSNENAALNCKDLKDKTPSLVSGVYRIDPHGRSHGNVFQAYCDQETDSGGWTLVWSYTLTAYSSFTSSANAVTPRPSWSASGANSQVSVTVPLRETDYEAMKFLLWSTIGKEFLIKSNINNWITCKEGMGSLEQWKTGPVTCKLVKQVSKQCADVVPKLLMLHGRGPYVSSSSFSNFYYFFDGDTRGSWPTHDPCGKDQTNQLKGVATRKYFCSLKLSLPKLSFA